MREIIFYKLKSGKSLIEEFLDTLSSKEAKKIIWVLRLIEEADAVSTKFYKNLIGSDGIVEVRVQHGTNHIKLIGFESNGTFVVLTNAFRKKDQKVSKKEITLAQERKKEYLSHE